MSGETNVQAVESKGETGALLYLYGIVSPGSEAAALLHGRRLSGVVDGALLFPIEVDGLVAAVSHVPAAVFDEEPLNALAADLEALTPYVVRHEAAVRALIGSAVIPMAFGSVYRSPERVASLLRERAAEFRALLEWFTGRQEWGVKVIADVARLRTAAEQEDEALQALATEAATASAGRAYLIGRKRDRLLSDAASRLAFESVREIVNDLAALSADTVQEEPGPAQPGAEQLAGKAAFLVDTAALDTFHNAVVTLEQRFALRGIRIEVSGPWAPYSFVRRTEQDHG